jgi:hypothetical protein
LKAASSTSIQLRQVDVQGHQVLCDISTGQLRSLISVPDRKSVFTALQKLAHTGICATRWLMKACVVCRGMSSDMVAWCKDCQPCARGKASPQHTAPVQPIAIPERQFTCVQMDLVGSLPTSTDRYRYLFTMVDMSSRWLEATPLKSMAAENDVGALISTWVTRFGLAAILTSDQGRQFTSTLWAGLTKLLGI